MAQEELELPAHRTTFSQCEGASDRVSFVGWRLPMPPTAEPVFAADEVPEAPDRPHVCRTIALGALESIGLAR